MFIALFIQHAKRMCGIIVLSTVCRLYRTLIQDSSLYHKYTIFKKNILNVMYVFDVYWTVHHCDN